MLDDLESDSEEREGWAPSLVLSLSACQDHTTVLNAAIKASDKQSLTYRLLGDLGSASKLDWLFSLDYSVLDDDTIEPIVRDHFGDDQLKVARDFYLAILMDFQSENNDEPR